jgi:hypothetical protein
MTIMRDERRGEGAYFLALYILPVCNILCAFFQFHKSVYELFWYEKYELTLIMISFRYKYLKYLKESSHNFILEVMYTCICTCDLWIVIYWRKVASEVRDMSRVHNFQDEVVFTFLQVLYTHTHTHLHTHLHTHTPTHTHTHFLTAKFSLLNKLKYE